MLAHEVFRRRNLFFPFPLCRTPSARALSCSAQRRWHEERSAAEPASAEKRPSIDDVLTAAASLRHDDLLPVHPTATSCSERRDAPERQAGRSRLCWISIVSGEDRYLIVFMLPCPRVPDLRRRSAEH